MEPQLGGNARWGRNEITAYPWAAHYVPVPDHRLTLVRELMEDLDVLRDGQWEERYLCHTPQERVFVHGRWREGFEPETKTDRVEWDRFFNRMAEFRASGHFTIPVAARPGLAELDRLSMRQWLDQNDFTSKYLHWYINYACRDDYGAMSSDTSAWMGIHYFAAREHDEKGPLTWAEGNGWIVQRMSERFREHIRTSEPVVRIAKNGHGWDVYTPQTRYTARAVIFAAPTLLGPRLIEGIPPITIPYSPWVTANLTLDRLPVEHGFERAWDNVIVDSPSLGYVDATHMSLRMHKERAVWTWYHALSDRNWWAARGGLLQSTWEDWKEFILADLSRAHPDIRDCVVRIDVMRFGHAMARPVVGSVFGENRRRIARGLDTLFLAHSDLSGYSIFEEAQARGVAAADHALRVT
jgi:glycine/D-amino acid oxidase-like deaminating enzyme